MGGAASAEGLPPEAALFTCSKGGRVPILWRSDRALEDADETSPASGWQERRKSRRQSHRHGLCRTQAHGYGQEIRPQEEEAGTTQEGRREEAGAGEEAGRPGSQARRTSPRHADPE